MTVQFREPLGRGIWEFVRDALGITDKENIKSLKINFEQNNVMSVEVLHKNCCGIGKEIYTSDNYKVGRNDCVNRISTKFASKYLAVFKNKCGGSDSLGIDYHWCGQGAGGTPNLQLIFNTKTGDLVDAVFLEESWNDTLPVYECDDDFRTFKMTSRGLIPSGVKK